MTIILQKKDFYNRVGQKINKKYLLTEFIDEGGMGIVYKAQEIVTNRQVAVKILRRRFLPDEKKGNFYIDKFLQEAEILKQLRHPNIVSFFDNGVDEDNVYIVTELLEGRTLDSEITRTGKMNLQRAEFILSQICEGLEFAHTQRILHLDIKPSNVFLINAGSPNETIKIIDFGLARIIQSTLGSTISRLLGTPQYMAPEIFTNKASHLSDIYSLGILTYQMLTGLLPYSNTHIYQLVQSQFHEPPPSIRKVNENINIHIDELITQTLSKNPLMRPRSVNSFYYEFKYRMNNNNSETLNKIDFEDDIKPILYLDNPSFGPNRVSFFFKALLYPILLLSPVFLLLSFYYNGTVINFSGHEFYLSYKIGIIGYLVSIAFVATLIFIKKPMIDQSNQGMVGFFLFPIIILLILIAIPFTLLIFIFIFPVVYLLDRKKK